MATVTPQEADAFLREIRSKKGVDDPRGSHYDNVEDLNKSLILLADQLYTKPTHFLLELIQNADDNNFTNPTPTLSFTLQKESRELRVDCNETGFTKENVKAICSIGRSTKGVVDRTKGFIGEKGIGFKSSFKVADVVHIASGPFQFKFDRRQTLGMIAPIPEPFPQGQKLPGQTQILLYLNSQDEVTIISDELKTIRSQLLIFLRKLSAITVKAPSRDIQFRISRKSYDVLLKGETAELTTTLKGFYELSRRKYVIVCFAVYDLPKDDRRPGVQESEIVLAFPVAEWSIHFSRSMTTDFLQYLIQADFILVANREAIELYAEWNFWVRQHIIEAFAKAVQRFVSIKGSSPASGLRYTWPVFLKDRGGTTVDFWSTLKISILEDLKSERILESRDDTAGLCFPTELWYIPYRFRLAGEPLVEEGNTRKSHLSFHYDTESSGMSRELSLIGVSEMTADRFFEELKSVVSRNSTFLQSQSTEWHAAVAKILQSEINPTRLANIPLIPLRNGKWVTHLAGKIFLDSEVDALTIPWCVDIEIVDATACKNRARRQLFKWLGIKTCDQADICRLILEQQDHYPFMFNANDPLESKLLIIDDAFYLFNTPTHVFNKSISKLYVLDDHGAIVHGKSLYVDYAIKGFRISSYANIEDSGVRMLHSRYLTRARKDGRETEFVKWLIRRLQVSTLPCLVRERQITQESRYFTTKAHLDLLLLLRDNWSHYCTQLWDMTPGDISSQSTALKELSFMKVKMHGWKILHSSRNGFAIATFEAGWQLSAIP